MHVHCLTAVRLFQIKTIIIIVFLYILYFLFTPSLLRSTITYRVVCMLCCGVEYTRLACNKSLPLGTYFQDHVRSLIQANHRKPHKQLALLRNVVRQLGFVVLVLDVVITLPDCISLFTLDTLHSALYRIVSYQVRLVPVRFIRASLTSRAVKT